MAKPLTAADREEALSYRLPMAVSAVRCLRLTSGPASFPVCPRCHTSMDREFQRFCDRCGQALDWSSFSRAEVERIS